MAANLPDRHALAEKARGQDRGPDRHGEFDRHHLAQRNQRQREEPAELRGIVNEIAPDMLQRPRRLHRRESAVEADQRVQHEEAEDRAHLHDLKHVQFARGLAAGDRHDQHQAQASPPSTARPLVWKVFGPSAGVPGMPRRAEGVGRAGRYRRPRRICNAQICRCSDAPSQFRCGSVRPIGAKGSVEFRVGCRIPMTNSGRTCSCLPCNRPNGQSHAAFRTASRSMVPADGSCLPARPAATRRANINPIWPGRSASRLRRIIKLLGGGRGRSRAHRPPDLVFDQPQRIRSRGRRYRRGLARDARAKFPALDAALHRRPGRCARQGRDRSHRVRTGGIGISEATEISR